jgi:tetratricopeptide (TPR) repeat protein
MRSGDLAGLAELEAGVELARRIGSWVLPRGLINLAAAHSSLGELRRAYKVHEEAGRAAEKMGQEFQRKYIRGGRAGYLYWLGRWDEAKAAAEAFIAESAESPHYLEYGNLLTRALIEFARGDTDGALADAERSAELARLARDPQVVFTALGLLAKLLFESGRSDTARDVAEELLTHSAAGEMPGFPPQADTAFALSKLAGAERVLELIDRNPRTPWTDASNAAVEGEFVVAADICSLVGNVTSEAFARLRAAEKLLAEGRRADADVQLQKALAFYRSVGATRYVREGEALLAASA